MMLLGSLPSLLPSLASRVRHPDAHLLSSDVLRAWRMGSLTTWQQRA